MSALTDLGWKGEYESCGALPSRHGATETLGFEVPQLLHEVAGLHQGHVSEVEVTEDLVLEPSRSLLVGSGQIQATTVTLETLLVVVTVLVSWVGKCY